MPTKMRIAETPFLADWFVISMRWLILLGMTITIAITGKLSQGAMAVLLGAAVWNIFIVMLAILNRRLPWHRPVTLATDWAILLLVFFVTGGMSGPVLWAGLLGVVSAGIYYGFRGSMISALAFGLVQSYWTVDFLRQVMGRSLIDSFSAPLLMESGWIVLAVDLLLGLVVGGLSNRLVKALRRAYQDQVDAITESERKAQQAEHLRMQAFYRLLETLSATLNYQVVLDTALELSETALGSSESSAGKLVGAVLLLRDQELRVGAARGFPPGDLHQSFPAERGELRAIVQTGEARLVADPASDPELGRLAALQACRAALALPLRRGLGSYGVMLFAHPEPDFFTPDRVEVLEVISHQAVIAIQNARLYQDVQQEKERIIETQDEARKQLARDLHDGPTQSVASIAMGISIARRMLERSPQEAQEELARVEDLARRTSQEIRHMLFTLRPLVLESEGLAAALQAMADKMRDTYGQNVAVQADPGVEEQMEAGKQTMVFYLAEEAVNNARKHAHASQITVRLVLLPKDPCVALLEINDNGVGFDVPTVTHAYDRRGSLGMVNLRERTDLINGVFNIHSTPGRGTCVSVLIPLTNEATDRLQRGLVIAYSLT